VSWHQLNIAPFSICVTRSSGSGGQLAVVGWSPESHPPKCVDIIDLMSTDILQGKTNGAVAVDRNQARYTPEVGPAVKAL
jgi:hypothetical protein